MSELSGTAAVGIETVEWLDGGSGNLTVRVTGRWRRRRPVSSGQVTLVVESEGRRHRFPAMPEPPSVGGVGPGMWRLSFSVPGWLAPGLGGHTWLSIGSVTVPLPAPGAGGDVSAPGPASAPPAPPAPPVAEPEPAGPEPETASAAPPMSEAAPAAPVADPAPAAPIPAPAPPVAEHVPAPEPAPPAAAAHDQRTEPDSGARMQELERALAELRSEHEQLAASLADGERTRRIAEQRAHAEQALRRDLARRLAAQAREAERAREAMGELAAAEDRIRGLERQLRDAQRREDEAEQLAAAAAAARARAERAQRPSPMPPDARPSHREIASPSAADSAARAEADRVRFEQRLRAHRTGHDVRVPSEPRRPMGAGPEPESPPEREPEPLSESPPEGEPEPPLEPDPRPAAPPAVPAAPEPTALASPGGLVDTLRRELDARAAADAALRTRVVSAETRLAARVLVDQRTSEALTQLRGELESLRGALHSERTRRQAAERAAADVERERRGRAEAESRIGRLERELGGQRERSRDARQAIAELRGALERLASPPSLPPPPSGSSPPPPSGSSPPPAEPAPASAEPAPPPAEPAPDPDLSPPDDAPLRAERLSGALARLRESVPPPEPQPTPEPLVPVAGGRTLEGPFRRLVKRDADAAGELLLDLLALQRVAYPHPVAYDLALGPGRGCVQVTVGEGPPSVELGGAARTRDEVDFRVSGEPARVARLLTAHGIWRRLGPRVARVRGRREGLAALTALLSLPLDLVALQRAGARLRPAATLGLVAAMVAPAWTAGERFVIAHRDSEGVSVYLIARDGRGLELARTAPAGRIATTIDAPADELVAILAGSAAPEARVSGDTGPLTSLQTWINHARSV